MKKIVLVMASWTSLVLTFAVTACAQTVDVFTLQEIYGETDDSSELYEQAPETTWSSDGRAYTIVEDSAAVDNGQDIVRYQLPTLERSVAVSAEHLVPTERNDPLTIDGYQWSDDDRFVLIFTNEVEITTRWLGKRGDYWLFDVDTKKLRRVGENASPSGLMDAAFSPDSKRIAYVYENNIYVENIAKGNSIQLTHDGSDVILNGVGDWANEAEFAILRNSRFTIDPGLVWSPDSQRIGYWQYDTSGVGMYYMIKNTDVIYPELIALKYPKSGTRNSAVRVGVVSAVGGETVWFNLTGDPRENYVPRMNWATNSDELMIQRMNRLQNKNQVYIGNANNGQVKQLFIDEDEAWVEAYLDNPIWLQDGSHFVWLSERDGWRRPYLVSRDAKTLEPLTTGAFDVISIERIDEVNAYIYFTAAPDDPKSRSLFRTRLFGDRTLERVTPENMEGTHTYDISPNAEWAFHTYSRFGVPPQMQLVGLLNHEAKVKIVSNKKLNSRLAATPRNDVEFFRIDIGASVLLDAWIMKPPSFDPSKKYPLLVYVYSEPMGQTVADRWYNRRYLWHLMLTQKGYVVASVDSRGANAPRGRDWRKSIYGAVGVQASDDQAEALRAILRERPYLDAERVAIWGSSGGGSMTLNAMFRYPDLYKVGIAIASVPDQRLYDTIYQERYMGTPQDNAEGYAAGSPISFAENLNGDLLIIHGTADDNVHYQGMEQLVDKLIEHNKQFSMMVYPDRSHSISEKKNTQIHMYTLMTRFLEMHLPSHE